MMPFAREWDEAETFPVERKLRRAAALGFGGIYVGADVGGSGAVATRYRDHFRGMAQGCVSTAAYISIHNMVAGLIDVYGSGLRQRVLLRALQHGAVRQLLPDRAGSGPTPPA